MPTTIFEGWGAALAGGALIGGAASLLLWLNGATAGVSGILGHLVSPTGPGSEPTSAARSPWRITFVLGLLGAGAVARGLAPDAIGASLMATLPAALLVGVAVGAGTSLGSGCTSGHGVCGLSSGSVRSLVATLVFMGAGMATATLLGWSGRAG